MHKIIAVKPLRNLHIAIEFADGFKAEIDIQPFIKGGISSGLENANVFNSVSLDGFSGISWSNGFDFCPNFLRELAEKNLQKTA